jgi:flagellar protein FliO/FliZ
MRPAPFASAALLGLFSSSAHALQSAASPPTSIIGGGAMFQVVLSLLLVLGAVYLVFWLLRRINPGGGAGGVLKVVGGVMVGPRERIVIVELGDSWMLLGVSQGSVTLLTTMPRPSDAERLAGHPAGFADWLRQALPKKSAR